MLKTLLLTAGGLSALTASTFVSPRPVLVWNASESVPIGLYAIRPVGSLRPSDLVLVMPPEPLANALNAAGYLPKGVPLLKHVVGLPGQTVCRDGLKINIDNVTWAIAQERDHAGRLLPVWSGCRRILFGEVFLLNWTNPASLDGRYFGPISTAGLLGRATPIWTGGGR